MSSDKVEEESRPLKGHDHQSLNTTAPGGEVNGLAADTSQQSSPRKHDSPKETQSQCATKCSEIPSDSIVPSPNLVTFSPKEYSVLLEDHDLIRQENGEHKARIKAIEEENEALKVALASAEHTIRVEREESTIEREKLKMEKEALVRTCTNHTANHSTLSQKLEESQDEHETTKQLLAELKQDAETSRKAAEDHHSHCVQAELQEKRDLSRELQDDKAQLKEIEQEPESGGRQVEHYKNAWVMAQEQSNVKSRELSDTKSQLEKVEEQRDALQLVNDLNGAHNMNIRDRLGKAEASLNEARKDLSGKTKLEKDYEHLQEQLNAKENERNERNARQLKADHRFDDKVTDSKVKDDFEELRFQIEQFVHVYCKPLPGAVDQELNPMWKDLTPDARMYLESDDLHSRIIEAYIWEWLRRTIFASDSEAWAGQMGKTFSKVVAEANRMITGLGDELYVEYQSFRSGSSSFLARLNDRHNLIALFRPDTEAMVTELRSVCTSFDLHSAVTATMGILDHARRLDITLRKHKAEFYWVFGKGTSTRRVVPRYGFPLKSSAMNNVFRVRSDTAADQPTVELVIVPGLHKRGNNDGAEYRTVSCCVKSEVACNISRLLPQRETPVNTQAGQSGGPEGSGHLRTVQAITEADTSNVDSISTFGQTSNAFRGWTPANRKQDNVVHQPEIAARGKLRRPGRVIAAGQRSRCSLGGSVCQGQPKYAFSAGEPPKAETGDLGGKTTRKRKTRPDDCDDEMDGTRTP